MDSQQKKINALVVDDSSEFRNLLKSHLRQLGANVVGETDSAINLHQVIGDKVVDLVFLDINMPGPSGLDALPELKKQYPAIGVVIISGENSAETVSAALKAGADDYILKPFSSKKVQEVINDFVKTKQNKPPSKVNCYVVDDEPLALEMLEVRLTKMGGSVRKFSSIPQFFIAMEDTLPDIVYLDIQMPQANGFDVLQKIKRQWPHQYVIMVSAESSIENVKKSIELHSDGFLVKPVSIRKLEESLVNYRKLRGK